MDHAQFKTNQTAAGYVAHGLDERTQEAFEMHMMGCPECVDDVEAWRAIKIDMPRPRPVLHTAARASSNYGNWRMAASLLLGAVAGAVGGWLGKSSQALDLDSTQTVVFNVPAVTRGAEECTALRLASDTKVAILRVPGVSRDLRVVAMDSEKRELPASRYTVRMQPDGSQLVRIDARLLDGRAVHLEARRADGSSEPLVCITGQSSSDNAL